MYPLYRVSNKRFNSHISRTLFPDLYSSLEKSSVVFTKEKYLPRERFKKFFAVNIPLSCLNCILSERFRNSFLSFYSYFYRSFPIPYSVHVTTIVTIVHFPSIRMFLRLRFETVLRLRSGSHRAFYFLVSVRFTHITHRGYLTRFNIPDLSLRTSEQRINNTPTFLLRHGSPSQRRLKGNEDGNYLRSSRRAVEFIIADEGNPTIKRTSLSIKIIARILFFLFFFLRVPPRWSGTKGVTKRARGGLGNRSTRFQRRRRPTDSIRR